MDIERDSYAILQVSPKADEIVIHAAYRALARRYHPDGDRPNASRMSEINRAYADVRDPEVRRRYDRRRSTATWQAVPVGDHPRAADAGARRSPGREATVIDFGRYAGWSISQLARHDPDYLRWLSRHSSGIRFRDSILRILPAEPDLTRRGSSVA